MEHSSFGRMITVLTSPTRTFQSIAERPTWAVPLLVLIVLGLVSVALVVPKMDWEATAQARLELSGREISPEELDLKIRTAKELANSGVLYFWVFVFMWIAQALTAAIFLGLLRLAGGWMKFKTSFSVSLYSSMPGAVAIVLSIPFLLAKERFVDDGLDRGVLMSNLAWLPGADSNVVLGSLASSADLFSFWSIALLTIGYAVAAKVSRGRAAVCVVGLWLLWVAFKTVVLALGL